jgi:hypothetical protein
VPREGPPSGTKVNPSRLSGRDHGRTDLVPSRALIFALAVGSLGGFLFWRVPRPALHAYDYVAALCIGLGVVTAAERGGGRPGKSLALAAGSATLVPMAVSLYLVYRTQMLKAQPGATYPIWIGIARTRQLMRSGTLAYPRIATSAVLSVVVATAQGRGGSPWARPRPTSPAPS